jgi:hypothetical protein
MLIGEGSSYALVYAYHIKAYSMYTSETTNNIIWRFQIAQIYPT